MNKASELNQLLSAYNDAKARETNTNTTLSGDSNTLLKHLLETAKGVANENANLRRTLNQQNKKTDNTLSTTQFFDPVLAKDMYNMNGNSLQVNSYQAVRKMVGIINNNTPNVQQPIDALNIQWGANGLPQGVSLNGTGVGLSNGKQVQGWWLWIMILERLDYFSNLVTFECSDSKLLKCLNRYMFDVALSGRAMILKDNDNYRNFAVTDVKLKSNGDVKSFSYFNSSYVMNATYDDLDKDEGIFKVTKDNEKDFVVGCWKGNGYNIWFYVMSYLINAVDLLYIFWNRARLNRTVVVQKKGNSNTATQEAINFLNPYQTVISINSAGYDEEDDGEETTAQHTLENRYDVLQYGDGQETQYSFTHFTQWLDYWDNTIGIRTSPVNTNTNRSIANEIEPLVLKLSKLQQDYLNQLDYFIADIKEKWGIEVTYVCNDNVLIEQMTAGQNPRNKAEEGGQTEDEAAQDAGTGTGGAI